MKKEKGPAPLPPSLPNSVVSTRQKESAEEKLASETNADNESDNKPKPKQITDSPKSTASDDSSSQSEVMTVLHISFSTIFSKRKIVIQKFLAFATD